MYMHSKWKRKTLQWYFSGKLWYVSIVDKDYGEKVRNTPTGAGETQDEAFKELKGLIKK